MPTPDDAFDLVARGLGRHLANQAESYLAEHWRAKHMLPTRADLPQLIAKADRLKQSPLMAAVPDREVLEIVLEAEGYDVAACSALLDKALNAD